MKDEDSCERKHWIYNCQSIQKQVTLYKCLCIIACTLGQMRYFGITKAPEKCKSKQAFQILPLNFCFQSLIEKLHFSIIIIIFAGNIHVPSQWATFKPENSRLHDIKWVYSIKQSYLWEWDGQYLYLTGTPISNISEQVKTFLFS